MALAALIFLPESGWEGEIEPTPSVLGLALPVYQARRVAQVGCKHIVVYSPTISRYVLALIDAMKADGLSASIARNPSELASAFHPQELVALFAPGRVVQSELLSKLLNAGEMVLTVLPAAEADPAYRIDAQHAWAGLAIVPASIIRMANEVLGDWAGELALLRIATQQGAGRKLVSGSQVIDLAQADRRAAMLDRINPKQGMQTHSDAILATAMRRFSIFASGKGVTPAHAAVFALFMMIFSAMLGWLYAPSVALVPAALAIMGVVTLQQMTHLRLESGAWSDRLMAGAMFVSASLILALGVSAMLFDGQWGNLALAIWLVAHAVIGRLDRSPAAVIALLSGLSIACVFVPPSWGFALALAAMLLASASRSWRRRRGK